MIPTLLVGDYLFVSKYSYGYSRYSFPYGWGPFSGRILFSQPTPGDVIVFKDPKDNSTDYIKRLVGMPGDKIQMINGVLNINGTPIKRERAPDLVLDDHFSQELRDNAGHVAVHQYRETLPDGRAPHSKAFRNLPNMAHAAARTIRKCLSCRLSTIS